MKGGAEGGELADEFRGEVAGSAGLFIGGEGQDGDGYGRAAFAAAESKEPSGDDEEEEEEGQDVDDEGTYRDDMQIFNRIREGSRIECE